MRCGCPACGAYMAHAESAHLGCVCPECGRRCADCLGTNTVLSRDQLLKLREDPTALEGFFSLAGREESPPPRDSFEDIDPEPPA